MNTNDFMTNVYLAREYSVIFKLAKVIKEILSKVNGMCSSVTHMLLKILISDYIYPLPLVTEDLKLRRNLTMDNEVVWNISTRRTLKAMQDSR